jgi:hypothetical protein
VKKSSGPPLPPAGLAVSWPEVELLMCALRDGSQMRAALWAALGGSPDENAEQAARYALMLARFSVACEQADAARAAWGSHQLAAGR